jgi:hypothetical protein
MRPIGIGTTPPRRRVLWQHGQLLMRSASRPRRRPTTTGRMGRPKRDRDGPCGIEGEARPTPRRAARTGRPSTSLYRVSVPRRRAACRRFPGEADALPTGHLRGGRRAVASTGSANGGQANGGQDPAREGPSYSPRGLMPSRSVHPLRVRTSASATCPSSARTYAPDRIAPLSWACPLLHGQLVGADLGLAVAGSILGVDRVAVGALRQSADERRAQRLVD